jgi:cleavage and polyadenylation specificity factor subunit 1
MMDHATHWPKVVPIPDMSAETVANAFIATWVSRFGCPSVVTTDQGRQFESRLFYSLSKSLGTKRIRTNAYHPQSNGLIENFHKTLKTAITTCPDSTHWNQYLPFILLVLRSAINTDHDLCPAEALYGQELRLPGDIFTPNPPRDHEEIVKRIAHASSIFSTLSHHDTQRHSYFPSLLNSCSHVFVRDDRVKPTFTPPYNGPFKILNRSEKTFTLDIRSKPKEISIDRLKPCFILSEEIPLQQKTSFTIPENTSNTSAPTPFEPSQENTVNSSSAPRFVTRAGRVSKPPVRFGVNTVHFI